MLENFLSYLRVERRYSDHTILAYQNDIAAFISFGEIQDTSDYAEVTPSLIRSWMVDLIQSGQVNKTVNRKLSALRSFFHFLRKESVVVHNPMQKVRGPKNERRLPIFAKESELQPERIAPMFSDDFDGVRDRLMLEMFYQTGIRLSELVGLKIEHVTNTQIKVLGKRNKERIIPVSDELAQQMSVYLQLRSELLAKSSAFFLLKNGNKLYDKFVYRKINHYLGMATSLDKRSPHVLRHTFATHMLNNGAGLETLKDILGHANLSATQVYTHNSFAQLTKVYSHAHPRGR
jgi:integrase/recombinase XerC